MKSSSCADPTCICPVFTGDKLVMARQELALLRDKLRTSSPAGSVLIWKTGIGKFFKIPSLWQEICLLGFLLSLLYF